MSSRAVWCGARAADVMKGKDMRVNKVLLAPSLQCAPPLTLDRSVQALSAAGMDMLHIDLMDAHFVPNLALNFDIMQALGDITDLPLDVHMMFQRPDLYLRRTMEAGASAISFHLEALDDPRASIAQVKANHCKAGLAISPQTQVERLYPFLPDLDFVLVMAVRPGFAGQTFLPDTLGRLRALAAWREAHHADFKLSVDGGIDAENGRACMAQGADILVTGAKCMFHPGADLYEEALAFARMMQ